VHQLVLLVVRALPLVVLPAAHAARAEAEAHAAGVKPEADPAGADPDADVAGGGADAGVPFAPFHRVAPRVAGTARHRRVEVGARARMRSADVELDLPSAVALLAPHGDEGTERGGLCVAMRRVGPRPERESEVAGARDLGVGGSPLEHRVGDRPPLPDAQP